MKLQYEFDMAKDTGGTDSKALAAKMRLEAYANMLPEKKEREKDAEQD